MIDGFLHGEGNRQFRSKVWEEFSKIRVGGVVTKGQCVHCNIEISAKHGAGTSAMSTHLKRCKSRLGVTLVVNQLKSTVMSPEGIALKDWRFNQDVSMKLLLSTFEQLSGLKINFHKSEIFCFGRAKDHEDFYSQLFGCALGKYPFCYLGLPMHFRKLLNKDWKNIEERIEKRLSGWKGKMLTCGGRLVLINSVLSSLPMFMMSFFELPKGVLEKFDDFRSRFYW